MLEPDLWGTVTIYSTKMAPLNLQVVYINYLFNYYNINIILDDMICECIFSENLETFVEGMSNQLASGGGNKSRVICFVFFCNNNL
jgi:hypothetical protein